MKRILIAGIGNIFFGDDAFGCEVVRQLSMRDWPDEVRVTDFGIRSYDLAYAMTGNHDLIILVDAAPRGQAPGMTSLIELDLEQRPSEPPVDPDGHSLDPYHALQLAQSLGGITAKVFLVSCEPAILERDDGEITLSPAVRDAVPQAVAMIDSLIADFAGLEIHQPPASYR
jgi:hydrogenase maturation protease